MKKHFRIFVIRFQLGDELELGCHATGRISVCKTNVADLHSD